MVTTTQRMKHLAEAENHLWAITNQYHFADIKAANGVISGEDMATKKLDAYFADPKHSEHVPAFHDLSFLKGKDGQPDQDVAAFVKAHPEAEAGFVEYANQYRVISDAKHGLDSKLADKTIAAVDDLYKDGHYHQGRFDVGHVMQGLMDVHSDDLLVYGSDMNDNETEKRAQTLHKQQGMRFLGVQLSTYFSAFGLGLVGSGFLRKNEAHKNIGWLATIAGLLGVIYNYHKGVKLDKELNEPENANVILQGTPISPLENKICDAGEAVGLLNPPIKGELTPPETVIVQGRKAWAEKMAEQKYSPEKNQSSANR